MSFPGRMINRISLFLPRLGLSALMICLVSGLILVFYYRPTGNVFQNVEEITTLVPYGWFFRQIHYGAGQVFVILMLLHTLDHFLQQRYRSYALREWISLIVSLALCLYALFTGFILKGDQEGVFAGRIFMNILGTLPIIGKTVARLLITPGDGFFFLPYLYHCFFLPVLIIYLMRGHIGKWFPDDRFLFSAGIALSLYALLVRPGIDIPPETPASVVHGPWFFLGVQSLLRGLPSFLAGMVLPGLFIGCMVALPAVGSVLRTLSFNGRIIGVGERGLYYFLVMSIFIYAILTVRAAIWGP